MSAEYLESVYLELGVQLPKGSELRCMVYAESLVRALISLGGFKNGEVSERLSKGLAV